MTRMSVVMAMAIALVGCKKSAEKAPAGDKEKPGAAAEAAKPLAFKKLGSLPLEAEVPADADINDTTQGAGFPSVTIYASPTTFVFGGGDMSDLKPTIEDTKTKLGKDPNKLKTFTKEEKTADGWILELSRESMAEPGKELFGISVRRTIDGKPYDCTTNAQTADQRAKAERLCVSLRAAK